MTGHQREIAELLRDLGKPAELIATQAQMPVDHVREWLGSGAWKPRLFDAGELPREMTQPARTLGGYRGLSLFSRDPVGKPVQSNHSGMEVFE